MTAPVTPETLTDEIIRDAWSTCPNSFTGRDLMAALGEPYPMGAYPSAEVISMARQRICDVINARRAKEQP